MSNLEIIMWCLAYAIGQNPSIAEIKRAKQELLSVRPESVNKVMKSTEMLLPYMTERETSLYWKQICTCTLAAVGYRVAMRVKRRSARGCGICPRCQSPIDRDYQSYCDRCGQHLSWR